MKAKELSAKDLMIGDWVNYRGIYNKIAPADFDEHHKEWIDEIEPVLLTPEILCDNFSSNPHWWFLGCTDVKLRISKDGSSYTLYIAKKGVDVSLKIRYTHELQHALRLCGIEKEIVL